MVYPKKIHVPPTSKLKSEQQFKIANVQYNDCANNLEAASWVFVPAL